MWVRRGGVPYQTIMLCFSLSWLAGMSLNSDCFKISLWLLAAGLQCNTAAAVAGQGRHKRPLMPQNAGRQLMQAGGASHASSHCRPRQERVRAGGGVQSAKRTWRPARAAQQTRQGRPTISSDRRRAAQADRVTWRQRRHGQRLAARCCACQKRCKLAKQSHLGSLAVPSLVHGHVAAG